MSESIFFRLLKTPVDDKGDALAAQIAGLNATGEAEETYALAPTDFSLIPGSPFAYWVGEGLLDVFSSFSLIGSLDVHVGKGPDTGDDFRFLRAWWECEPSCIGTHRRWVHHPKGGAYSRFYSDVHLLIHWQLNGDLIHQHGNIRNRSFFFRPGFTWSRRTTSRLSVRAMPRDCIFGDKGPAGFVPDDDSDSLLVLLAVMNSIPFEALVKLQLGAATAAARSYEVGVIQRTPIPSLTDHDSPIGLSILAREAHDLQRDRTDETTHAFCLPGLAHHLDKSLLRGSSALEAEAQAAQARLSAIQAEIDDLAFDLYSLGEADRALVRAEMDQSQSQIVNRKPQIEISESADKPVLPESLPTHVQYLFMWCVGVAFGRWDVRKALDSTRLPSQGGPFDPLPRCSPGALVDAEGLPASRDEIGDYLLPIAWDGILVDDPTHPSDIVARVRQVLALLWGDRADAVEREACQILGVKGLRDYFRDPRKGLFALHIKRYSKSRRKAPIYWLLQSEKRNYAIWLYYHRLEDTTLYTAGRDYADAKVALEQARLEELRQGVDTLSGTARRRREREIERQDKLVAEVTDFRDRLDAIALLNLPPDLNDGVVISVAPLWKLVPWKEAQKTWEKLVAGEYPWSTMARQMRERGLVERKM